VYYGIFSDTHKITRNRLNFNQMFFHLFYLTVIANCYLNDAAAGGNWAFIRIFRHLFLF
jgi:hypothetical protein